MRAEGGKQERRERKKKLNQRKNAERRLYVWGKNLFVFTTTYVITNVQNVVTNKHKTTSSNLSKIRLFLEYSRFINKADKFLMLSPISFGIFGKLPNNLPYFLEKLNSKVIVKTCHHK